MAGSPSTLEHLAAPCQPLSVASGSLLLWNADCREIIPHIAKVDAVITDPPYGIGFAAQPTRYQRANGMVAAEWDNERPQDIIDELVRRSWPLVIWGGNYFTLPPSRGWLVWSKTGNAPSMADLEMAWTNRDMNARAFEKSVKSASLEKSLQHAPHPTQKPVALMAWSMESLAVPEGGTVLDPFMGSGTTAIACIRTGRKFIGVERDPAHFKTAVERIRRELAQGDLFLPANIPVSESAKPTSL